MQSSQSGSSNSDAVIGRGFVRIHLVETASLDETGTKLRIEMLANFEPVCTRLY